MSVFVSLWTMGELTAIVHLKMRDLVVYQCKSLDHVFNLENCPNVLSYVIFSFGPNLYFNIAEGLMSIL